MSYSQCDQALNQSKRTPKPMVPNSSYLGLACADEHNGLSRKRRGLAEIQLRIAEFKRSGLSKPEFAARVGVHPLSMDRWLRITQPSQSPQPTHFIASKNSPAFVPVLCTLPASASSAD